MICETFLEVISAMSLWQESVKQEVQDKANERG